MYASAIALVLAGIVLGILIPPFGFLVAVAGLVVLVLAFVGGRRERPRTP